MSKLTIQSPIVHIPKFTRWGIQRYYLVKRLEEMGIKSIMDNVTTGEDVSIVFDGWYYYTTLEGWGKVLYDLVFSSNLYNNVFDCDKYALKAYIECCQRYKMNTLLVCLGKIPKGYHAFNIFPYGDETGIEGAILWEPNDGFGCSGEAFEIREYGYEPQLALI